VTAVGMGVSSAALAHSYVGSIAPSAVNNLDCNGWSNAYKAARPPMRELCTDPISIHNGKASRLIDNGWYVGHDEPSVKFISSANGSGNTMTYTMQLPVDPSAAPTASGSVTDYGELSVAPWFGLAMCDPKSYPQNPCTPDSDKNSGLISNPNAAGSAFMELQFYPPGFAPFIDSESCSATQWCSAINIDSLACTFNFATCNTACEEPVNFAFLQTNGVPSGPAAPQDPSVSTFVPNGNTLMMNPGDSLKVSISDPSGGLLTQVWDLTTGQTGYMQASASNGFANTNMADCSGNPFTWHAEYNTAKQPNQVPWAALEGGVLMEQEIGHGESCDSLSNRLGFRSRYTDGSSYVDPQVFQTCDGGMEGANATGEGCTFSSNGISCNATTQGGGACPTTDPTSGALCEFSDANCFPEGSRPVMIDGSPSEETSPLNFCFDNAFQNGDLDFDGNGYQEGSWPNGQSNTPTPIVYTSPMSGNTPYSKVQFETDVGGSSSMCDTVTGTDCAVPPIGANFYPYWTLSGSKSNGGGGGGGCMWSLGTTIPGFTTNSFGGDAEYGAPNVARYGGTIISPVTTNPAMQGHCGA
jgi:hypothetical protein